MQCNACITEAMQCMYYRGNALEEWRQMDKCKVLLDRCGTKYRGDIAAMQCNANKILS